MAQPYSTTAQVLNQALTLPMTDAGWVLTEVTGDVAIRIQEADTMIDAKLASWGYILPFATNPPLLMQLSVLYSRYACLRDLYTGRSPSIASSDAMKAYKDRFDELFKQIEDGKASLVTSAGAVVPNTKYDVTNAAVDVAPIFTMTDPENQGVVDTLYSDPSVTGGDGINPATGDGDGDNDD